jgi:hypothetical protein
MQIFSVLFVCLNRFHSWRSPMTPTLHTGRIPLTTLNKPRQQALLAYLHTYSPMGAKVMTLH